MRKYIDFISLTQTDNWEAVGNQCWAFETFCIVKKHGCIFPLPQRAIFWASSLPFSFPQSIHLWFLLNRRSTKASIGPRVIRILVWPDIAHYFPLILWLLYTIIIIIIIIIFDITFTQGVYNHIPETINVSRVYPVAAVLYLHFMLHVMLFRTCEICFVLLHYYFIITIIILLDVLLPVPVAARSYA
jgi:hypothetical protein